MSRRPRGRAALLSVSALIAVLGLHACAGSPTSPETAKTVRMTLAYENACSGPIDLKFFDRTNGTVWPDQTSSYEVASQQRRSFNLDCKAQSQVCYGANERANTSHYWGVGLDNTQTCSDCCVPCSETIPPAKILVCN